MTQNHGKKSVNLVCVGRIRFLIDLAGGIVGQMKKQLLISGWTGLTKIGMSVMGKKFARIEHHPEGLRFFSSYDAGLVAGLKGNINSVDRAWDKNKKCWIVAHQHEDELIRLCEMWLDTTPQIIHKIIHSTTQGQAITKTELFRVEYIGQVKDRGNGDRSAFGGVKKIGDLEWSIVFPESVLKNWFEGDSQKKSVNQSTRYAVLAVKHDASPDAIKSAWRKQIKRFHPDINSDPDAAEMTIKINEAYDILCNPTMRRKYDAGLKLEASLNQPQTKNRFDNYTIPIRCGLIMAQGTYKVGRFVVSEIISWQDIVEGGRTLVTSWDTGTNSLVRNWI